MNFPHNDFNTLAWFFFFSRGKRQNRQKTAGYRKNAHSCALAEFMSVLPKLAVQSGQQEIGQQ